jgi:uncharacterized protein (TIGR01777 family)
LRFWSLQMTQQAILITGGTGFIGSALTVKCLNEARPVTIFSRSAEKVTGTFANRVQAVTDFDQLPDAGQFKAVVNLAGAGIFDRRWTESRKRVLRDSRIRFTEQLVGWMAKSRSGPSVFISGSAIGYYGDQGDSVLTEQSETVVDFSQKLCSDWEKTALRAENYGVRVCLIRTGLVLGRGGGLLERMLPVFRLGLGGRMGNGRQYMSWVHLQDWLAIAQQMIENPAMVGPYNATAPNPVPNQIFSETFAAVLHRSLLLPLPEVILKPLLGEMAQLVLGSQRVLPQRLLDQGFQFKYPQLKSALQAILSKRSE